MYVFIPEIFFVPVYYAQEDILNIKNTVILQQGNYDSSFINKIRDRKDIVIGVSLPNQREARWVKDKEAMEAFAKEKGVTLKMEFNEFDAAKQKSQVEDLISQGIDVLIFVPNDVLVAAELVEKAHNAGIKVISYDNVVKNSDPDLYTSFNNIRVGELQGRYLTEKAPRGNYIIMSGDPGGTMFKEGAMEFIQPLVNIGNIKIVTDKVIKGWDPTIAFNVVKDSLIANKNKIDSILAPNDATAGAAIEALKEQGLSGKVPVTGQDADLAAVERIIQGTQLMTVLKDTRELAKTAIDAAIKLAKGEVVNANTTVNNGKINVPAILVNPIAIDKNNIDSFLIGSGYYKKEDIYKRLILEECNSFNKFTNKTKKRKELVIGVSLPTQREDIWVRFKNYMENNTKDKGVILKIENADFDADKQTSQIENLISQGIDVLILVSTKGLDGEAIVEKAHKAGIKVISYDALVRNSDVDLYVAFNNIRVGELQGKYLTEKVPKGNYIIMYADPDGIFKEGAMEYIIPLVAKGNIKIVEDKAIKDWDPKIAFKIVEDALIANNNKIDAILAPNDAIAGAAIEALQAQGLAGKVAVTGQDADLAAIKRIIKRTQSMTVFKDIREAAKITIDAAIKLAKGQDIEVNGEINNGKINVPSIFLTPIAVDKDNVDSVIIDSGYLKPKEIYE